MKLKTQIQLLAMLSIAILIYGAKCSYDKSKNKYEKIKDNVLQIVHDTTIIEKNVYIRETAEIESLKQLIKILKSDTSNLNAFLDSLALKYAAIEKELKSKKAELQSVASFNNALLVEIKDLKAQIKDSVYFANYNDKDGLYQTNLSFDTKKETFDFSFKAFDSYNVVRYEKEGRTFLRIENRNPFVLLSNVQDFEVSRNKKDRRFGIGLVVGYGVNFNRNKGVNFGYGVNFGVLYRLY